MVQSLDDARRRNQSVNRVPPHNLQAEQSLLGAMLLSRDAIASAVETCSAGDFYKPAHGHVFDAITSLYSQGEPADPLTVADVLGRGNLLDAIGGIPALVALQADTPATANAGRYARIVEEHALLRRLIAVAGEIAELGYGVPEDVIATVDRAESLVFEIAERRVTDSLKPLRVLLEDSLDRLSALYSRGESITGVPTGFADLDERLSGLQKSALIIVGARPAMGKCVAWDNPDRRPGHRGGDHDRGDVPGSPRVASLRRAVQPGPRPPALGPRDLRLGGRRRQAGLPGPDPTRTGDPHHGGASVPHGARLDAAARAVGGHPDRGAAPDPRLRYGPASRSGGGGPRLRARRRDLRRPRLLA